MALMSALQRCCSPSSRLKYLLGRNFTSLYSSRLTTVSTNRVAITPIILQSIGGRWNGSCLLVPSHYIILQSRCNHSQQRDGRNQYIDFRKCQTIEELTALAYYHKEMLSPRNMAAFWARVSKLLQRRGRRPAPKYEQMQMQLDELIGKTLQSIHTYRSRDLSTIAISFAKIAKKVDKSRHSKGSPQQILYNVLIGDNSNNKQFIFNEITYAAIPILYEFDARSLSNLIYAFGLAEVIISAEDGGTFFDSLAEVAKPILHEFNGQDLSNMLWAFGNMKISNPQLFEKAGDTIVAFDGLGDLWPQALSNILWAFAKLEEPHPKLFIKLSDHISGLGNLDGFKSQHLSNIVWAYATAGEAHPKLFKRVAEHIAVMKNLVGFRPQALSNTVWAYATAKESHPKLFSKVTDHFNELDNLGDFSSQALSNTLWAYATTGESHPMLFQKLANHIATLANLDEFKPQHLSNTVWAFATAKESHPKLFNKLANHIASLDNLNEFKPQALKDIVWAYATAGESHPKLFQKVGNHIDALANLNDFKPQELSNTAWAYATAKESHPALFQKLSDAAIQRQYEFNEPQHIANFLWAYATHGQVVYSNLFLSFVPTVEANLGKCNEQELANIAWSYAVANVDAPSVFNDEFINVCIDKENEFNVDELSQLHQWQLWQGELESNVSLPPSLQKKCYNSFVSRVPDPSKLQDDVISQLTSIGLQLEEEVLTKSAYRLDAIVSVNRKKIGVEVDGPFHFTDRNPNGSTILKRRQVTTLDDIPVVSVPYWEWNKLKKDSDKKQQYLRDLLYVI